MNSFEIWQLHILHPNYSSWRISREHDTFWGILSHEEFHHLQHHNVHPRPHTDIVLHKICVYSAGKEMVAYNSCCMAIKMIYTTLGVLSHGEFYHCSTALSTLKPHEHAQTV